MSFRQNLQQPVFESIADGRAQTPGQRSMRLGGIRQRALLGEDALYFRVVLGVHVRAIMPDGLPSRSASALTALRLRLYSPSA